MTYCRPLPLPKSLIYAMEKTSRPLLAPVELEVREQIERRQ